MDTLSEIQQSMSNFSLEGPAVASVEIGEEPQAAFDTQSGSDDRMPLDMAVSAQQIKQSLLWREVYAQLSQLLAKFDAEAANPKNASRLSALDRAEGLRAGMKIISEVFDSADERLNTATSEERLRIPDSARRAAAPSAGTPRPNVARIVVDVIEPTLTAEDISANTARIVKRMETEKREAWGIKNFRDVFDADVPSKN